jgi:hypothetical protein
LFPSRNGTYFPFFSSLCGDIVLMWIGPIFHFIFIPPIFSQITHSDEAHIFTQDEKLPVYFHFSGNGLSWAIYEENYQIWDFWNISLWLNTFTILKRFIKESLSLMNLIFHHNMI